MATKAQPKYKAFGDEFKQLRLAQGIATHTEIAKLLGVAQQTVTRWEAGESRPRAEQMAALAKVLSANPQRLLVVSGHAVEQTTVSFDQPLPLPSLSPEGFQRFCRSILEALHPGAKVHAAGKTGHEQFGIDIDVELGNGEVHSFQCKREAQFGAAKVKAAVKAHKTKSARKFILLSRVASPLARREMKKHRAWDIWDQDDLSEKLRLLPVEAKRRLVDTYFHGLRFALLGEPSAGPWLTPEDFFAPLVVADRPFSHHWELVGRASERSEIARALADNNQLVVALLGPAGGGKSRTLRAALDGFSKTHPAQTVLVLSPTEQVTTKSLEDLGFAEKLLVVDDAHDRTELELLVRYTANPAMHGRLLLVYRPYAKEVIDRHLGEYGLRSASVVLEKPTKADAIELATHVLKSLGGPEHAAKLIADVAYDSPLSVVVGAWIVAKDGLHPELFGSHETFKSTVLGKYREAIAKSVSNSTKDRDVIERMLRVIALIQPVVPDDPKVLAIYEAIEGVSATDATRLTKLLIASGVLFKRGIRYRLSPDLLADSIIESGYITESGASNGQAERVFEAAITEHKAHLLLNLGRLDWRRNDGDTSDSGLLNALWMSLKWEGDYVHAHLNAAVEAAYYQPRHALQFARRLIDDGHGDQADVCRLIRKAAYNLNHLRHACELLWELGRNDTRPTNQNPNHPLRLLTEMTAPEPHVPILYIEVITDFMLSLIPYDDSWTTAHTPFAVLEGALAAEGHFTSKATSRAITFTSYGVDIEVVRHIRHKIIDAILESLTSNNYRRAFEAAGALQHALRGPTVIMNRQPSKEECAEWDKDFVNTLERVNARIEQQRLLPAVLVRLAQSVSWHARYACGATAEPAKRVWLHLDRDLETSVTRILMDGWGTSTWNHGIDLLNDQDKIQAAIEIELDEAYPIPHDLASFMNDRLVDISVQSRESHQSSHIFVAALLKDRPALARVILAGRAEFARSPISQFAPFCLSVLIKHAPDEAEALIDSLLAEGNHQLSFVADGYAISFDGSDGLTARDRSLLSRIFSSTDPLVYGYASRLFHKVATYDTRFAIELLTGANPTLAMEQRREIFMWFDDDKLIPLESLTENVTKDILKMFSDAPRIEEHFALGFLARVAKRRPGLIVDLAKERVERASEQADGWNAPFGYLSRRNRPFNMLEHPDGSILLLGVLEWALPQIENYRFSHCLANLVSGVFGIGHPTCIDILETWCTNVRSEQHFKVLAAVLRQAPRSFVFEHRAFVTRILRAARSVGVSPHRNLASSLYAAATSGVRSGIPGEPFPEDITIKAKAEEVIAHLSTGDPAYAMYNDIREHSEHNINRSLAEGRAMAEADTEE